MHMYLNLLLILYLKKRLKWISFDATYSKSSYPAPSRKGSGLQLRDPLRKPFPLPSSSFPIECVSIIKKLPDLQPIVNINPGIISKRWWPQGDEFCWERQRDHSFLQTKKLRLEKSRVRWTQAIYQLCVVSAIFCRHQRCRTERLHHGGSWTWQDRSAWPLQQGMPSEGTRQQTEIRWSDHLAGKWGDKKPARGRRNC